MGPQLVLSDSLQPFGAWVGLTCRVQLSDRLLFGGRDNLQLACRVLRRAFLTKIDLVLSHIPSFINSELHQFRVANDPSPNLLQQQEDEQTPAQTSS